MSSDQAQVPSPSANEASACAYEWSLIESDPGVFTELLERIGVKGVSVHDVLMLDRDELEIYDTVYGLIMLFKWKPNSVFQPPGEVVLDAPVYFVKQVVDNACATMAILNTVCNYPDAIEMGSEMKRFTEFTQDLDPESRGVQASEFDLFRNAHNSFAPPVLFKQQTQAGSSSDVYHFVTFIYRDGFVWMLDGLQAGPVRCGAATESTFIDGMIDAASAFMAQSGATDTTGMGQGISFTVLAVVPDIRPQFERKLARQEAMQAAGEYNSDFDDQLKVRVQRIHEEFETDKRNNARRRHNYVPMFVALLKALEEKKLLSGIVEDAKKKRAAAKITSTPAAESPTKLL